MKKLNLLFILFGFATLSFLSSCEGETEDELAPLLNLTTVNVSSSNTVVEGTTFSIEVDAAQNPTSGKKIDELEIQTPGADTTININAASYTGTFTFNAPANGVSNTYTFIITDNANVQTTETVTVTGVTNVVAGPIDSYSAKLLGGQTNATVGSAFASTTGLVYLQANAITNSALIDFVYYYGATNLATFAAPSDETVDGTGANSTNQTASYATQNETIFMATSISAAQFTAMTDDSDFPAVTGSLTKLNMQAIGNVFAFETAAGKVGLVHIDDLNTGSAGDVTINVKVQQ